ncbi:MAG: GNAT family N-acetyltransferase [Alphaproteobacteria bacterium]|nr:GNAT family N-acetyltransferase [Alphaproteobacteria bacterium]
MLDTISIRSWTENDWVAFRAIRLEALKHTEHVFGVSYDHALNLSEEYWTDTLQDTYNGAVFGLYDGENVIGLTAVFRHRDHKSDTVIFAMSYIRKNYRGRGLSDLLYKARLDWAEQQEGIVSIWIGHRDGNQASFRANQRHGFQLISTEDMTFGDGTTDKHYTYELKINKNKQDAYHA